MSYDTLILVADMLYQLRHADCLRITCRNFCVKINKMLNLMQWNKINVKHFIYILVINFVLASQTQ